MKKYISDLYKRKDLILYLVTSGLKAQHRNSFLGYFWWLLDPLLGVFIYYFVVVVVFRRGGEDYGIFLVVGMIVWRWLSSTITSASRSIVGQAGVITQVYLPKAIFPICAAISQLVNFGFGLLVIAIFFIFFELVPGVELLWLPYITIMQLLFTLAIASSIAYVCVFVRDIDNLVGPLLRLWFFGSPVIWREDMIPEGGRWLLDINPMSHFLASYRNVFIYDRSPDYITLLYIGSISAIVLVFMIFFYSKHEHRIIRAL